MFDIQNDHFITDLDPETRAIFASLNNSRIEYFEALVEFYKLRAAVLASPTPEAEESLNNFGKVVIAPLRRAQTPEIEVLLKQAVNVDGIKSILPMLLMAVLNSVDLPMLLALLNIDPDMIEEMTNRVSAFIKSGDT